MASNPAIVAAAVVALMVAQQVSAGFPNQYWQPPSTGGAPPAGGGRGGGRFKPSDWNDGSATFYGDPSGLGADFGGACGYSANDLASLYSTNTAALSTPLFDDGNGCGQCYQIRCVKSPWCNPGAPTITVTGTNLCPPNWYEDSNNGGWCNPPRQHFDLAPPSFLTLAARVAGIVPVQFRRVPCQRTGGVRFCLQGNPYWLLLFVMNVAGSGDVYEVAVQSAGNDGWVQATHNWGITYQAFAALDNSQSLAVRLTSYTSPQQTIIVDDAMGPYWTTGLCYQGSKNFR